MPISLPVVFVLCLVVGLVLYLVGGRVGTKGETSASKVAPYACGEDLPPERLQVDMEKFLIYAVYFLIFDVLAFILVTSLYSPGFFPIIYASIGLMAAVFLLPLLRRG